MSNDAHQPATLCSRLRAVPLLLFIGMLLLTASTSGQEEPPAGPRLIIRQDGIAIQSGPPAARPENVIPSDEELARVELSDSLLKEIALLDHNEFDQRESAMQAIATAPGGNLPLYAILARASEFSLSPEQHARILAALRDRIFNKPCGALGISMQAQRNMENERIEVEVIDLLPDLPAREILRIGDRIIALEGKPFESQFELTARVQERSPGETVALTVLRPQRDENGRFVMNNQARIALEELELRITLGTTERLRDPRTGRPQISDVVAAKRRQEMSEAERRFGRKPLNIKIEGELPPPSPQLPGQRGQIMRLGVPQPRPELADALFEAIINGNEPLALQLIEQGAPVDSRDERNVSVLHVAARATLPIVVRRLLEYGADVEATYDGTTQPIHWASRAGASDRPNAAQTIDVLLQFGADINARTAGGERPITYAIMFRNESWRDFLQSRGAVAE